MSNDTNSLTNLDASKLPPALLEILPALPPPPGVTPNFIDPPSCADLGKGFVYTFLPLMVCFVILRIYTRARVSRGFGVDDWTCVIAAIAIVANSILFLQGLGNPFGPHQWNTRIKDYSSDFVVRTLVTTVLYSFTAIMIKTSILTLNWRYFGPSPLARYMIWAGIIVIGLFYAACLIANLIFCTPRPGDNWLSPATNRRCGHNDLRLSAGQGIFSVISDFYVLAIPLVQVMRLHVSTPRKIGLTTIFLTGLLACIFSLLSCVYRFRVKGSDDYAWNSVYVYGFATAELAAGTICSCMPVVFVVLRGIFYSLRSTISSWHLLTNPLKRSNDRPRPPSAATDDNRRPNISVGIHRHQLPSEKLPQVPRGTLLTLRSMVRNVFGSASASAAGHALDDRGDRVTLTNLSNLEENAGKDEYHTHLWGVRSER